MRCSVPSGSCQLRRKCLLLQQGASNALPISSSEQVGPKNAIMARRSISVAPLQGVTDLRPSRPRLDGTSMMVASLGMRAPDILMALYDGNPSQLRFDAGADLPALMFSAGIDESNKEAFANMQRICSLLNAS